MFFAGMHCLTKTSSHRGEQLRTHVRARPGTRGKADSARCRFSKVGDALIEVHVPALDATDHLFVLGDGSRRARPGADLAGRAEFVCAEAVGRGCDQGHVGGDPGETYT